MEVQLAVTSARNDGHHHIVPNYLKPSTGSCHNACKYGGTQTLEAHQPPAKTPDDRFQKRRSLLPRKLFGRGGKQGAVDAAVKVKDKKKKKTKEAESSGVEEWKDIVAYDDDTVAASHGSSSSLPAEPDKQQQSSSAQLIMDDGGGAKRRQKESLDSKKLQAKPPMMTTTSSKASVAEPTPTPTPTHKSLHTGTGGTKGVRPPRGGKKILPAVSVAARKKAAVVVDRELVDGYQPLSPSLLQNRASLLRDLEEEMMVVVREEDTASNNTSELKTAYDDSLDHIQEEEHAIAAAETSSSTRPVIIPAHRRAKSMSIGSRFALARQASRNSSATTTTTLIKLRSSKSSKGPTTTVQSQQEESKKKPARLRSRRGGSSSSLGGGGDELESSSAGGSRGIQLRIRSLRRRGVGGSSGGTAGFVVPAVSLRHQKTLEKKRSQRLYNNVIEETASKLVKTRKSRVKALVGAFESVISKIAK